MKRIAIIGGGFSGTMTAVHLLLKTSGRIHLRIYEKQPRRLGRGVAYSTEHDCHLLNVRAAGMSALPAEPSHFLEWARRFADRNPKGADTERPNADTFLPRRWYGQYLGELFESAVAAAKGHHTVEVVTEEASDIVPVEGGVTVLSSNGASFAADASILALGNFRPVDPLRRAGLDTDGIVFHADPWADGALKRLAEARTCLVLGAGLSMLDVVRSLDASGFAGRIHVLSRRGLRPKPHGQAGHHIARAEAPSFTGLPDLVRAVRREAVAKPVEEGGWRAVIDGLRPYVPALWQSLSIYEQRRFIRHVRSFWEIHRHRCSPEIFQEFQEIAQAGRIVLHQGRVSDLRRAGNGAVDVSFRTPFDEQQLTVDQIVNCTGSECDFRTIDTPLARNLLTRGLATACPNGFGLGASPDGRLLKRSREVSPRLYALGPVLKGVLWESTAVPELRVQAHRLAELLMSEI